MKTQNFHQEFKSIPLEEIEEGKTYAFTLNPIDLRPESLVGVHKGWLQEDVKLDLMSSIKKHKKYLANLNYCSVELYPELSPTGRLHYHGKITIYHPLFFSHRDLRILQVYGKYCITHINDALDDDKKKKKYPNWDAYCTKQLKYFDKEYPKTLPIKYCPPCYYDYENEKPF